MLFLALHLFWDHNYLFLQEYFLSIFGFRLRSLNQSQENCLEKAEEMVIQLFTLRVESFDKNISPFEENLKFPLFSERFEKERFILAE